MTVWPDLGAGSSARLTAMPVEWPALARPVGAGEGPSVRFPQPPQDDKAALTGIAAPAAPERAPPTVSGASPRRRFWIWAALLASAVAHAAVILVLAERLSRAGVEAESDAVSVELVLEPAPADEPAIAGNAGDTQAPSAAEPEKSAEEPAEPEAADAGASSPEKTELSQASETSEPDQAEANPAQQEPGETAEVQPTGPAATPDVSMATPFAPLSDTPPDLAAAQPAPAETPSPVVAQPLPEILTASPFRRELETAPAMPDAPMPAMDEKALALLASPPRIAPPSDAEARPEPQPRDKPKTPDKPKQAVVKHQPSELETPKAKTPAAKSLPKTKAERPDSRQGKASAAANKPSAKTGDTPRDARVAGNAARSAASAGGEAQFARKVASHIQRFKRYPDEAARAGMKGVVRVSITIDRAGGLSASRIVGSSGHAVLDREAIATARRAAPYPRMPDSVAARTLSFSFLLRFDG